MDAPRPLSRIAVAPLANLAPLALKPAPAKIPPDAQAYGLAITASGKKRALIGQYRAAIEEVLPRLDAGRHALALEIAQLPDGVRGYGHVKERHVRAVNPKWDQLLQAWRA